MLDGCLGGRGEGLVPDAEVVAVGGVDKCLLLGGGETHVNVIIEC